MFNYLIYCLINTTLEIHWVSTSCNILQPFSNDSLCKDSCCCRTITSIVTSLACNTLNELCTCILEVIFKFYFLSNGDSIFSDLRSTKLFTNNNITSLRTECYLYCVCQLVYTTLQEFTRICIEFYLFCHFLYSLLCLFMFCFLLIFL